MLKAADLPRQHPVDKRDLEYEPQAPHAQIRHPSASALLEPRHTLDHVDRLARNRPSTGRVRLEHLPVVVVAILSALRSVAIVVIPLARLLANKRVLPADTVPVGDSKRVRVRAGERVRERGQQRHVARGQPGYVGER